MLKIGINGFGRIGRLTARIILQNYQDKLDLSCINTSGSIDTDGWAYLFKYDSCYGRYPGKIEVEKDSFLIDGKKIPVLAERDPQKIPWNDYNVKIVVESTGVFRKTEDVQKHLRGSVEKVVLSAPPKDEGINMYVIGINDEEIKDQQIISCASCTTNCTAPVVKVIEENFGIEKSLMTTIHAYTASQEILDGSHRKDLRRGRAAALNIVPTTTGAAKATAKVYPQIKDKFDGMAVRVPVATGSLTDFVFLTKEQVTEDKVNKAFTESSRKELQGVLGVTDEPLVLQDVVGTKLSVIVDLSLTKVVAGNLVKVIGWYDNEWGYANRLVEEAMLIGRDL